VRLSKKNATARALELVDLIENMVDGGVLAVDDDECVDVPDDHQELMGAKFLGRWR